MIHVQMKLIEICKDRLLTCTIKLQPIKVRNLIQIEHKIQVLNLFLKFIAKMS